MKKWFLIILLILTWNVPAWAHTELDGLPDGVAIMSYKQVLYLNPDDLETRNKLAMAYYRTNKIDEAGKELEYVLKKDPKNFDALDGYGIVLMRMKKYREALPYLTQAANMNEKDTMVHVHLSVLYEKMKMRDKAKAEWKKAQSLASPDEKKKLKAEWNLVKGR